MNEKTDNELQSPQQAFDHFSCEALNKQFESLNLELQDSNYKLLNKVAELDVITDYLQNILDHISQGILFLDLNGTITTCNVAAEKILGIHSREVISHRFWDRFNDHVFGFSIRDILQGRQETSIYNVGYLSPNNHHSELEVSTSFVLKNNQEASGKNQGLIIMIRDVTEMRYLQTLADRADRMKVLGEMAAQVAHEIRNPLGGIKGFASLLKRDLKNHPEMQQMAASIVEGTDTLDHLVDQILHYSRPVQTHMETTDLIPLLKQMKEHIMADANIYKPNINIHIEAPFLELTLPLDPGLFKSALLNLIVNAIQAMPNGGDITLALHKHLHHIVLSVSDTGMGIPEDLIPKLYSPFFTTKHNGNGLGLIEVQKVVQAHGGTIDVASIVDQGTTFTIKLPLKKKVL